MAENKKGEKAVAILTVPFTAMISPLSDLNVSTSLINLPAFAPSFIVNYSDAYGHPDNIDLAMQCSYAAPFVLRYLRSYESSATVALGSAVSADVSTRAWPMKYLEYASITINQYLGWRAIFWSLTILSGVPFLTLFVFLSQTGHKVVGNGRILSSWWNMSIPAYVKQQRQRRQGIEPDTSLKMPFERFGGIILSSSALVYGGYYMLLTTLSSEFSVCFVFSSVIIGACCLPLGFDSPSYRHTDGHLLDRNFRLSIEKMRQQVSLPFVYLTCVVVMRYGRAMQAKASLAGIEVCLFFCGVSIAGVTHALNTLTVNTQVGSQATPFAAKISRWHLVDAGAAAVSSPLIDWTRMGWTGVFVTGLWVILSVSLWLVIARGREWRHAGREG
ncbi:putative MFS transporter [Annulohypoxylon truncatum]|uniref:putative MFS transporter n=1 Tax=Annulohypoxylon truncatum TaxID=327061 RepID=UPI002007CBAB|nr:putative MFS transporter [Annulohypoxylon truncatum]KAI1207811.1 putative MFS transporter [Annulohypoxylon truncatum]